VWAVDVQSHISVAAWNRPIRFRDGVGGHAPVTEVAVDGHAVALRRLVYAHIGRPAIRAIGARARLKFGEWRIEGHMYHLAVPG
jgi:hypothetical protein